MKKRCVPLALGGMPLFFFPRGCRIPGCVYELWAERDVCPMAYAIPGASPWHQCVGI